MNIIQNILITAGGTFGKVKVQVRTVGGNEEWDNTVGQDPGRDNETIGQALGNRDMSRQAKVV